MYNFKYDDFGKVIEMKTRITFLTESFRGNIRYNYAHNANSDLACVEDVVNQTKYSFGYDSLGNVLSVKNSDSQCLDRLTAFNGHGITYDESGNAYSFVYNGTQYYYVKNPQGDVMRIVDATGSVMANYFLDFSEVL